MTEIGSIEGSVTLSTREWDKAAGKVQRSTNDLKGKLNAVGGAARGLRGPISEVASGLSGLNGITGGALSSINGLAGGIKGLTSAFTGPLGIALFATTALVGHFVTKQKEAKEATEKATQAVRDHATALANLDTKLKLVGASTYEVARANATVNYIRNIGKAVEENDRLKEIDKERATIAKEMAQNASSADHGLFSSDADDRAAERSVELAAEKKKLLGEIAAKEQAIYQGELDIVDAQEAHGKQKKAQSEADANAAKAQLEADARRKQAQQQILAGEKAIADLKNQVALIGTDGLERELLLNKQKLDAALKMPGILAEQKQAIESYYEELEEGIYLRYEELDALEVAKRLEEERLDLQKRQNRAAKEAADLAEREAQAIKDAAKAQQDSMNAALSGTISGIGSAAAGGSISGIASAAISGVAGMAGTAAGTAIGGPAGALAGPIAAAVGGVLSSIVGGLLDKMGDMFGELTSFLSGMGGKLGEKGFAAAKRFGAAGVVSSGAMIAAGPATSPLGAMVAVGVQFAAVAATLADLAKETENYALMQKFGDDQLDKLVSAMEPAVRNFHDITPVIGMITDHLVQMVPPLNGVGRVMFEVVKNTGVALGVFGTMMLANGVIFVSVARDVNSAISWVGLNLAWMGEGIAHFVANLPFADEAAKKRAEEATEARIESQRIHDERMEISAKAVDEATEAFNTHRQNVDDLNNLQYEEIQLMKESNRQRMQENLLNISGARVRGAVWRVSGAISG